MVEKIGVDIVQNKRIKLRLAFLRKVLSEHELQMLDQFVSKRQKQEFVSGRWAVKEAIIKTLTVKETMHKLDIGYQANGAPVIKNPEYAHILISISHEKKYSVGIALNQTYN
ncbi:hypothetical protein LD125_00235 [Mesoplasma sp. JKS002658]|nr:MULTISPECIES: 4'-phosphopantetheinyl transferase superfamily protein [unclassified Mesoplasma]MCL8211254.1 hypothetical protein [Mesoplasma sp. JKS002664]MCL8211915.1 hypothetical protein [Mesoplasma sp. JKS002662]MCL8213101.1 hypothetical protein [Mesoplasma sp. JKS002660]MCL8213980.1 hypothetical protein [Mesoplasma sp. JKS002658]MCL8214592.1 hypothetical protein [Mesoplasma sp. JKS002663]